MAETSNVRSWPCFDQITLTNTALGAVVANLAEKMRGAVWVIGKEA